MSYRPVPVCWGLTEAMAADKGASFGGGQGPGGDDYPVVAVAIEMGPELPQPQPRSIGEHLADCPASLTHQADQGLPRPGSAVGHGPRHVHDQGDRQPSILGVPAGEHVINVVSGQDRQGLAGEVWHVAGRTRRRCLAGRSAQSGGVEGPGHAGPRERRTERVDALRPFRIECGLGGDEQRKALQRGVVPAGQHLRSFVAGLPGRRQPGVFGHQAHLPVPGGESGLVAHCPRLRDDLRESQRRGVHALVLPNGLRERTGRHHPVAGRRRVVDDEANGRVVLDQMGQRLPGAARLSQPSRRLLARHHEDRARGEDGARAVRALRARRPKGAVAVQDTSSGIQTSASSLLT